MAPESANEPSGHLRREVIGDATLYLGDCRDILPTLTVDHVISDPPYEDELHKVFGSARAIRTDGKKRSRHDTLGFEGVNAHRAAFAEAMVRACSGWLIAFSLAEGIRAWRDDIQAAGGKWDQTLFWVKPDATPRFNGQGPARGAECAAVAWCGPGHRRWNAGGKRGVYTHCVNVGRQGEHPTEKPLPLMMDLIGDFTRPGELIADPFLGSGTTGVACALLGRRFVGVEREPAYFDLACRRIEEAYRQPRLFDEPPPRPVQPGIFDGEARMIQTAQPLSGPGHTAQDGLAPYEPSNLPPHGA